jgi:hypothetical protein
VNKIERCIIERRIIAAGLRALDGKWAATYPQMLVRRISYLAGLPKDHPWYEAEISWLGRELLRLVETGDTKTLKQIVDARDHLRKPGEISNRKRYDRLCAYLKVYERRRTPTEDQGTCHPIW